MIISAQKVALYLTEEPKNKTSLKKKCFLIGQWIKWERTDACLLETAFFLLKKNFKSMHKMSLFGKHSSDHMGCYLAPKFTTEFQQQTKSEGLSLPKAIENGPKKINK